jgi:hypothetical protein
MRETGLLILALAYGAAQAPGLTAEQVVALAKTFFRDTGELPMDVRVTKVVTDASGKLKRRSESSFRAVYQGKSTIRYVSGSLNAGGLFGSMSDSYFLDAAMRTLAPNTQEPAKLADLGDVEVRSFRAEGDFQRAFLPGDPRPYLLPGQIVTSVNTSKGKIVITNQYSARIEKAPAKR